MAIRLIVAVTDGDWFDQLRQTPNLTEANFWSPSDTNFRALEPGELFLFKLHSPNNLIVGGGVFAHANSMPCSLAWEAFGQSNGATSLAQMRLRIAKYRRESPNERDDFIIGCRILTQPFFLERAQWIPVPASFALTTVTFKTYSTEDPDGRRLWEAVADKLPEAMNETSEPASETGERHQARYGDPIFGPTAIGPGCFSDTSHGQLWASLRDFQGTHLTRSGRRTHSSVLRGRPASRLEWHIVSQGHP
jgi:putative restriction endonuclease